MAIYQRAGMDDVLVRVDSQLQYNANTCLDCKIVRISYDRTSTNGPSLGMSWIPFILDMLSLASDFSCHAASSRLFFRDSVARLDH